MLDENIIPIEFKCSRCKLDMRIILENGGCVCDRLHRNSIASKAKTDTVSDEGYYEYEDNVYEYIPIFRDDEE